MDPILARVMRRKTMGRTMLGAHLPHVAAGDRRSIMAFDGLAGAPSVVDGVLMAPVPLAPGVIWCGGHLLLSAMHDLPESVVASMTGRPVTDIIAHRDLTTAIRITGTTDDARRFDIPNAETRFTVFTTDAVTERLRVPFWSALLHVHFRLSDPGMRDALHAILCTALMPSVTVAAFMMVATMLITGEQPGRPYISAMVAAIALVTLGAWVRATISRWTTPHMHDARIRAYDRGLTRTRHEHRLQ